MNQKKKARRARGLGSDSGLDLAISRFTNSLGLFTHHMAITSGYGGVEEKDKHI